MELVIFRFGHQAGRNGMGSSEKDTLCSQLCVQGGQMSLFASGSAIPLNSRLTWQSSAR